MSYEQSNTRPDFDSVEKKFREHVAGAYNGKVQSFEDPASTPFDELYHDDFVSSVLKSKSEFRRRVKFLMSVGTKGELVFFKPLDSSRFEYKLHLANRAIDFTFHGIGTINKDGRVIQLEPFDDSKPTASQIKEFFQLHDLVDNMQDIKTFADSIFSANFEGNIEGEYVDFKGLKEKNHASYDSNIHFDKVEVIDLHHVEIVVTKQGDWRRHQVHTVVDGKIVRIETIKDADDLVYYLKAYERVHNSRDSTQADMEKAFNNVFHDEVEINIDGIGTRLGKADARKLAFTDFEEKANIKFDKIKVINPAQVEIVVTKENGWRRHQALGVKDGKIVKLVTVPDGVACGKEVTVTFTENSEPVSAK